jgi:hypothetical protein
MLASGGMVMFLELIDKRIRGAEALTHVLGHRPLVVIPYLYIEGERESTKLMRLRAMFDTQWQRLESTSLWQRLKM